VGTVAGIYGSASGGAAVTGGEFGLAAGAYGTRIVGISMVTGQVLYNITTDDTSFYPSADSVGDGKVFIPMDMGYLDCYNLLTGQLVWRSDQFDYPWGAFGAYSSAVAYGMYYWPTYDGVVAFNDSTGQRVWKFQAPAPAFETPYTMSNGTSEYSFFGSAMIADGKLYTYNTEHTPSQPLTRGWGLYCINATTGQGIWNVTNPMVPGAISDGYLTAGNSYDGYLYVFGKGQSSTSISAPQTEIVASHNAVISGSVLDQSPAQPGTPCVSAQSMGPYMEYLHMQNQMPSTVTGVPVSIDAVDPNGNFVHLATVTSDGASGTFTYTWTPTIAGDYKIMATFAGDESYGSSFAASYANVVNTQTTVTPTTSTITGFATTNDLTTYIAIAAIAIIIAIAIATVLILRKH
jgi:outer membrane protein assembly factor BamB